MPASHHDLPRRILILGIGNVLWADEGFGVRCVEAMAERFALPENVRLLDGGTQGLYLLPFLEEAEAVIIFDAIDFGLEPGTLHVLRDGAVPAFMGAKKMSLHQTGFQEVIAAAQMLGQCPERMLLIGVQPVELEDFGGSLRPEVRAQVPVSVEFALQRLSEWGYRPQPREAAPAALNDRALEIAAYEDGRPSEDAACRVGDARFLNDGGETA